MSLFDGLKKLNRRLNIWYRKGDITFVFFFSKKIFMPLAILFIMKLNDRVNEGTFFERNAL